MIIDMKRTLVLVFCLSFLATATVAATVGWSLPDHYVFFKNNNWKNYMNAADELVSHFKEVGVIPNDYDIDHNFISTSLPNDEGSIDASPAIAIKNIEALLDGTEGTNPKPSSALMGPYYSQTSLASASYAAYTGVTLVSSSTINDLSDKNIYPTFVRAMSPAKYIGLEWSLSFAKLGYTRFGVIYEKASSIVLESVEEGAQTYGYEVAGLYELPFVLSRDDEVAMGKLRKVLQAMKKAKISAFVLMLSSSTGRNHIPIFFEEAYKLGMAGSRHYNYMTTTTISQSMLDKWSFAQEHPDVAVGIISKSLTCNDSPIVGILRKGMGKDLIAYDCPVFEQVVLTYAGLGLAVKTLDSFGVNRQCLERDFYFDPVNNCTEQNDNIKAWLIDKANCTGSPYIQGGVCNELNLFEQNRGLDKLNFAQMVLLSSYYDVNINGVFRGEMIINKDGERGLVGIDIHYLNIQLERTSEGKYIPVVKPIANVLLSGRGDDIDFHGSKLATLESIVYPGGTMDNPNHEKVVDTITNIFYTLPLAYRLTVFVVAAILILFAFVVGTLAYYYRKTLIIKTSTPKMMMMMTLGAIFSFFSTIVLNLFPTPTNATCITFVWLLHVGWVFAFCSVLLTTFRLNLIFSAATKGKKEITVDDTRLFVILSMITIVMMIYLGIWTGVSPPIIEVVVIESQEIGIGDTYITQCSHGWFDYTLFIIELVTVAYGVVLAFSVRKLPSFYNNARLIGFAIYNWVIVMIISQALVLLLDFEPLEENLIISMAIFLSMTVMLCCFFIVKLIVIYQGKGNDIEKTKINFSRAHHISTTDIKSKSATRRPVVKNKNEQDQSSPVGETSVVSIYDGHE